TDTATGACRVHRRRATPTYALIAEAYMPNLENLNKQAKLIFEVLIAISILVCSVPPVRSHNSLLCLSGSCAVPVHPRRDGLPCGFLEIFEKRISARGNWITGSAAAEIWSRKFFRDGISVLR